MGDYFLKNSIEMSNEKLALRKAALVAMPKGPVPCTAGIAGKRVEIYDPREGKRRKRSYISSTTDFATKTVLLYFDDIQRLTRVLKIQVGQVGTFRPPPGLNLNCKTP